MQCVSPLPSAVLYFDDLLTRTNNRYGPKPTPPSAPFNPKARLNVEIKFAPFASGVRRYVPGKASAGESRAKRVECTADAKSEQDTEATGLAAVLQQSLLPSLLLDTLPKSQIDLFVTVLESDGWDNDLSMCVVHSGLRLDWADELGMCLQRCHGGFCRVSRGGNPHARTRNSLFGRPSPSPSLCPLSHSHTR